MAILNTHTENQNKVMQLSLKKKLKKTKERKPKSTTEMRNTLLYVTQSSDTQHMNKVETKFSSVVFEGV